MGKRTAYSYRRCSDPRQARGHSLVRQDFAAKVCERKGWELNTQLRLVDAGVSSYHGQNRLVGALGRFLQLVKDKRVVPGAVLIIEDQDRFSREQVFDALQVWVDLLGRGIGLYVETFDLEFSRDTINENPTLLHMAIGSMTRAHAESARKEELIRAGWAHKRELARAGRPIGNIAPAYLTLDVDAGAYVFKAGAVDTLRRIVGECLAGAAGLGPLTRRLNADQVPHFIPGRRWGKTYVHRLLTSRVLLGEYQPHVKTGGRRVPEGNPVTGYFPAVVTEAEFAQVANALSHRKNKGGGMRRAWCNLFTGLVWSAADQCGMSLEDVNAHGGRRLYLAAARATNERQLGSARVPYEHFRTAVLRFIGEITPADLAGEPVEDEARSLQAQVEHKEARMNEIEAELTGDGPGARRLARTLASLAEDAERLRERLAEVKAREDAGHPGTLRLTQGLIRDVDSAKGEDRDAKLSRLKARLADLIERIDVTVVAAHQFKRRVNCLLRFRAGGTRGVYFCLNRWGKTEEGLWLPEGVARPADVDLLAP